MAEGYGGIVGWWRAHVVANVTSQTTTTAVIHIDARINCPNAGYNVIGQFHCSIDCDGANRFNRQWMPSTSVPGGGDHTYASVDVTVSKTAVSRGVGCSCTLTFPNTTPPQLTGTSSASCTVQIGPAYSLLTHQGTSHSHTSATGSSGSRGSHPAHRRSHGRRYS